ncbi:unnamed protein product [Owenia fusiformis]|uniref:Ubiquitin carboxyl-terminal hydrolase n=1 Tax=Owenia fusiformis TaxID=6347 RepID=A0A8J1TF05_OWEFU|nr:unnamed protein product [Owenia fusiformis]
MAAQRWLPLESNPDVMNKYVRNLGAPDDWSFCDVFGMDSDLLAMVPRPVAAVLFLYPIKENSEGDPNEKQDPGTSLYFIKQTIGNACGTIGLIHAFLNNTDSITLPDGAHLKELLSKSSSLTPEERAKLLEEDECIGSAHEESAKEGQTAAPSIDEKVKLHFVTFIHSDGTLYEMDGRKSAPVNHGPTTKDSLLEDTCTVVKGFMERDPDEVNFTLVALAKQ